MYVTDGLINVIHSAHGNEVAYHSANFDDFGKSCAANVWPMCYGQLLKVFAYHASQISRPFCEVLLL